MTSLFFSWTASFEMFSERKARALKKFEQAEQNQWHHLEYLLKTI